MIDRQNKIKIGVTSGLRGFFPVMYDNDGPISTGMTAKDHAQGVVFAIQWAKDEFGSEWENHCDYGSEEEKPKNSGQTLVEFCDKMMRPNR